MTQEAAAYKPAMFSLYEEDDKRIDEISRRMAVVLGFRRPNRSDALRRILDSFDIDAWEERNRPSQNAA